MAEVGLVPLLEVVRGLSLERMLAMNTDLADCGRLKFVELLGRTGKALRMDDLGRADVAMRSNSASGIPASKQKLKYPTRDIPNP